MEFVELTSSECVARYRLGDAPLTGAWDRGELPEPRLHRIHAYPAKFPAFLTARALAYSEQEGHQVRRVGDVFCGCGTVAHEARRAGLAFWGCDINPVATLIAKAKSTHCSGSVLRRKGAQIAEMMATVSRQHELSADAVVRLNRWFSQTAFNDLAALLNAINVAVSSRSRYRPVFHCAFSAILKACSQWQQRSVKPAFDGAKGAENVQNAFLAQVELMAVAFDEAQKATGPVPDIRLANVLTVEVPHERVDLIVTSPPYVTSYEYADLHQLSSLWLGYVDDHRKLREGSIGTSQHDLNLRTQHAGLNKTGTQIVFTLYDQDPYAARGVAQYFLDMQKMARRCKEFLTDKGVAVFVIGNTRYRDVQIDNASHLAESLLEAGFKRVRATRRRISNKSATPFRDASGKYTRTPTSNPIYAEEFVLIAHL
ncbi:site-specific DNA-methyltransferase [Xanthomonas campestris]|uniref:site-specific DNA-methyltransferase n=1 Tax=Xanthomonas campestris TaxID=339 RepID=UPI000E0F40A8|nr:site-specific DNA-methyltransferase [Xanthomonas campestris]MDM7753919.1 site-specific DNA-methyltransferase [Xanthomonas campestris pv. campestris]MDM7762302.1 site-specific DNA-methyltransferase [Xanthomonas campestris pv. campestris]MEB1955756.1 site-specific DNA-methyltransferase [Xanthomonas campestris pv. campestris]